MLRISIFLLFSRICRALRVAVPVAFVSIIAASCDSLWPSATENDRGLGTSVIGEFLRSSARWNLQRDDEIGRGIRELLPNPLSRSDVESIGMHCDSPPSTTCSYLGKVVFRPHGMPQNSVHRGMQIVTTINIRVSYADLNSLTVRKEEVETAAE
jgi:hypothetical protein